MAAAMRASWTWALDFMLNEESPPTFVNCGSFRQAMVLRFYSPRQNVCFGNAQPVTVAVCRPGTDIPELPQDLRGEAEREPTPNESVERQFDVRVIYRRKF